MGYQDKTNASIRSQEADYYQERLKTADVLRQKSGELKSLVTPEDMPWETCPQGIIKYMVHEKMNTVENTLDIMMQFVPEGSRSGKHRHLGEEYMFIVEGRGYSLHWDVEMELGDTYTWKIPEEPSKWEWEAGDSVYIPPNTVHQHFNSDPENPVRFISAESRVMYYMGLDDLEQMENAPEFEAG